MAATLLNITLNFKKINPKNSNLKSFWAFLFSVFIYISVFYVFNLSLSTLLCTTKFWFVISNTLIIILAADFSSSKDQNDQNSHEQLEYLKSNAVRPKCDVQVPSLESQHVKSTVEEIVSNDHHDEDQEVDEKPEEKTIDVIYSSLTKYDHRCGNHESDENKPEIIITLNEENNHRSQQNPNEKIIFPEVKNGAIEVRNRKGKCVRSNSDKGILTAVAAENEEKFVLQRTLSEKRQEPAILEENDEYSNMSDEELNRRVEEFIRRFNSQIRLQAAKNRQNLQEQLHQIS